MLPVPSGVSAGTRATAAALAAGARRATAAPATEAHSLVWAEFSVGGLPTTNAGSRGGGSEGRSAPEPSEDPTSATAAPAPTTATATAPTPRPGCSRRACNPISR